MDRMSQQPAVPRTGACSSNVLARDSDLYPRYEALLELAHRVRKRTSIEAIADGIANGWRFCANVTAWRLVFEFDGALLVIDCDGTAVKVSHTRLDELPAADLSFWKDHIPVHLRHGRFDKSKLVVAEHLRSGRVWDIVVLPFDSEERGILVLALIGSGEPGFSATDLKFIGAVGDLLASEVGYVLTVDKLTESLRQLANHDALTGIPNRRSFDERFERYWRDSMRSGEPLSLLIVDIDHFKLYNDSYGHSTGDNCLRTVASALHAAIRRPLDFCARLGGEEFAVLLPQTPPAGAAKVGELLLEAVRQLAIAHRANGGRNIVTISVGSATAIAARSHSHMELYRAADEALYIAKTEGRDRMRQSEDAPIAPPGPAPA